jgi:hypothetical protein
MEQDGQAAQDEDRPILGIPFLCFLLAPRSLLVRGSYSWLPLRRTIQADEWSDFNEGHAPKRRG